MPFGFGGSSSSSRSQSSSFDQSSSSSVSGGASVSGSEQNIAFEDIFARMFGSAEGAASALDPSLLTDAANTLFQSGSGFMDSIGADAGSDFLKERLSADNPVLQEQIDLLGEDLSNFFAEELNPQITSQAIAGGQLGGGRQGVAQGRAISEVADQFTRGATALRAGDIAARDAAAGTIAGNTIEGARAGVESIPALAGVADMGFSAGLAPFERLSAILGDPTVLGTSFSSAADFARAWSESFGQSQATSTSKSKSASIGFGGGG